MSAASNSGAERRRFPRFDADFRVVVLRAGAVVGPAEVLDLSASGVQLRHALASGLGKEGDELTIRVTLPAQAPREEITLVGTVVRVGPREVALSFALADVGDAALLASLWCDRQIPRGSTDSR